MEDPFEVFERRDATREELQEAAQRLGPVVEPASFWSDIANDASMPADHRALALVELVRRHVAAGKTTVGSFAQTLNGAPWFEDNDLAVATEISGKLPVQWSEDDTVAVIALPGHHDTIYLVLSGHHPAVAIADALRRKSQEPRVDSSIIRQTGFSVAQ